jgi:hypothetical protein
MPMLRALTLYTIATLAIAAPAAAATIQQDFDAAQALLDAGKAAEARNAFTALLTRFSPGSQRAGRDWESGCGRTVACRSRSRIQERQRCGP